MELLAAQVFHGGVAQFVEVVRQYFRAESHGDSFGTLREQERELGRKRYRFLVASVVGELPFGGLGVEDDVECKLRQLRLYVSWCCGAVAGEYVSPVSLAVDEQVFLSHLHQGVAY